MPVQEQVIPLLLSKQTDVVALAQTGTGKTAAFGLPLVQRTDTSINQPQALVLSPTRELCLQITGDIKDFSKNHHQISTLAVYGGSSINTQIKALKRGVQIIAATPGRLLDLLRRNKIDTSAIRTVVLDEADELLNMGFQEDLNAIFDTLPKQYNTWLFSATMPNSVARIAKKYMDNPETVTVGTKNAGADNVDHKYLMVPARDRYQTLKSLIDFNPDMYGIVFCRTRRDTQDIAQKLSHEGYKADAIHGDLSQSQRDAVMNKFRKKRINLMVATDVASRGLDVNDLTHVINYQLPDDIESYTHRSGRTGRAGKSGVSIAIAHMKEKKKIRQIEKTIKQKFEYMEPPSPEAIRQKQLLEWVDKVKSAPADKHVLNEVLPVIYKEFESLSREEIIAQFAALQFGRFHNDAGHNGHGASHVSNGSSNGHGNMPEAGYERFFVNLGKKDNLNPGQLIGLINEETRTGGIDIGKIDLMRSFSFFEADKNQTHTILNAFKGRVEFNGRSVQVEVAKPDTGAPAPSGRGRSRKKRKYARA
jgi:ATP-dependent RNA helicase DeaD